MYTRQCEVCGRTEPEVCCNYHYNLTLLGFFAVTGAQWKKSYTGQDGYGHEREVDICKDCWKGFQSFMKSRLGIKETIK